MHLFACIPSSLRFPRTLSRLGQFPLLLPLKNYLPRLAKSAQFFLRVPTKLTFFYALQVKNFSDGTNLSSSWNSKFLITYNLKSLRLWGISKPKFFYHQIFTWILVYGIFYRSRGLRIFTVSTDRPLHFNHFCCRCCFSWMQTYAETWRNKILIHQRLYEHVFFTRSCDLFVQSLFQFNHCFQCSHRHVNVITIARMRRVFQRSTFQYRQPQCTLAVDEITDSRIITKINRRAIQIGNTRVRRMSGRMGDA